MVLGDGELRQLFFTEAARRMHQIELLWVRGEDGHTLGGVQGRHITQKPVGVHSHPSLRTENGHALAQLRWLHSLNSKLCETRGLFVLFIMAT